jgi:hypothetical protein
MEFFAKIENVFTITGRGCVIVPAETLESGFPFSLRNHDAIELRGPAGVTETYVAAIESVNVLPGPRRLAILLPTDVAKADVSREAEVWAERMRPNEQEGTRSASKT